MQIDEFLLERIGEDEQAAAAMRDDTDAAANPYATGASIEFERRWDPARVLAECTAKRRIIELWEMREFSWREIRMHAGAASALLDVMKAMATAYDWHPDFDESWRPAR